MKINLLKLIKKYLKIEDPKKLKKK